MTDDLLPCGTAVVQSFRHLIRQACHHCFIPSINQSFKRAGYSDNKRSCFLVVLQSCIPAIRQAVLPAILNVCCLLFLKHGLLDFLQTFRHKEPINFIRLYSYGSVWLSEVVFGIAIHYTPFVKRRLLCEMIFINGFMQKSLDISGGNGNGNKPFFPVTFNPSRRADYSVQPNTASCVLRHSKPS
ncbi:hypothetical protein SAMN02927916_3182 [Flavobacterium anhuiense]|uniref:Uncharacterized protein n=1 Tax=Flavobacterium anhuiense TaxID=459526 RepID=A0ABY0LWY6_9FLAO|nr:hypothetical protein SAMN02927916_3182 [Flavobacterium anhuiense]